MYRQELGAANALLFELLLQGHFIEIPEVLYYYSARGVRNRPNVKEEYKRARPDRDMPFWYFPFLVLAWNQARDIRRSKLGVLDKLEIETLLWAHTSVVAMTKLVYRTIALPFAPPEAFADFCDRIVEPKAHVVFHNHAEQDEHLFPKHWALKGGAKV
jgi:hypothetical protein